MAIADSVLVREIKGQRKPVPARTFRGEKITKIVPLFRKCVLQRRKKSNTPILFE